MIFELQNKSKKYQAITYFSTFFILVILLSLISYWIIGDKVSFSDYIGLTGGVLGAIFGWFTFSDFNDRHKGIKAIYGEDVTRTLPLDLIDRMNTDEWYFGILTEGSILWAVSSIESMHDDKGWITVNLCTGTFTPEKREYDKFNLITATGDRSTANIQLSKVIGFVELAST